MIVFEFLYDTFLWHPIYFCSVVLLFLVLFYIAYQNYKIWWILINTPLKKIKDLNKKGIVKLKGVVNRIKQVPNLDKPAVCFKKIIEKFESGERPSTWYWQEQKVEFNIVPFEVKDDTGSILVEISHIKHVDYYLSLDEIRGDNIKEEGSVREKYYILEDKSEVYMLGKLEIDENGKRRLVDTGGVPFMISDWEEKKLTKQYLRNSLFSTIAIIVIFVFGLFSTYPFWDSSYDGTVVDKFIKSEDKDSAVVYYIVLDTCKTLSFEESFWKKIKIGDRIKKPTRDYNTNIIKIN